MPVNGRPYKSDRMPPPSKARTRATPTHDTPVVVPVCIYAQLGGNQEAANAFLTFLLSEDINRNMPENNLMQSVLNNATWPEEEGYRYHTDLPTLNANITTERIGQEMDDWLMAWTNATV